jgi:GDP-L-fucose synthase
MKNLFKNKRILIAGGSGLLGTNLLIKLIELKSKVIASYKSKIQEKKLKKYYYKFDFTKIKDCILATKNKDIVFICAVQGSGIKGLKDNLTNSLSSNILIRANIIEACKINKVKNIIWVSSSTVYQPLNKKIKENNLNLNLDPYPIYQGVGWVYRYLEKLFLYYKKTQKMNIKIIRTSSIYGPFDNFDDNKSHVIPALIKKVFLKKKYLEVWGNKKIVRDFVYVEDLVNAMLTVTFNKKISVPINFSSGTPTTILDIGKKILKISKENKKLIFKFFGRSSASYRVLDNEKINKLIKNLKRTNLDCGLRKTIEWYKST